MDNPRQMTTRELFDLNQKLEVPAALTEAIRTFPTVAIAQHCDTKFEVSPFDFYATCPVCGVKFKFRSFSAQTEIQEVFDAVFEWLLSSEAQVIFRQRQQQIVAGL
jgi:hypothetical protein